MLNRQRNISMLGDGFYSRVSLGPKAVIDHCEPLVLRALDQLTRHDRPLAVSDFGAADGGTSLNLMRSVVKRSKQNFPDRPVTVTYTDLPDADFTSLFRNVAEGTRTEDSYLKRYSDVFVYGSGTSFYQQIFPAESLDLAFSASAMHYLSAKPCTIVDHIHSVGAHRDEFREYQAQAIRDWTTILLNRSAELASGGMLVMANFCIDDHGQYLGNTGNENLFENYNLLWRDLNRDQVITDGEYRNTAFQQHYKTVDEFIEPLIDQANPVFQSGLRLVSAKSEIVKCPFRTAFKQGSLNPEQFATEFVNTHRSWTSTTFRAGLDETRSEEDKNAILDELYRRFHSLVLDNPVGHAKDLIHLYLVGRKV